MVSGFDPQQDEGVRASAPYLSLTAFLTASSFTGLPVDPVFCSVDRFVFLAIFSSFAELVSL
jgi:hypothetical protein